MEAPGKENNFRILGQNSEESVQDPNEAAPEEGKEDQHLKDKGNMPIEEDGVNSKKRTRIFEGNVPNIVEKF
jgi:hypothetical protein